MATNNPTLTAPAPTVFTELWYAEAEDTGLKQIFGVQSVPSIISAPEDVTYRALESDTEFAVPGVRPYESIEIEILYYKEQWAELKAAEAKHAEVWFYVKMSDQSAGGDGNKPTVIKWRGSMAVSLSEITLDDMYKCMLKAGKSTVPQTVEGLPETSAPTL